MYVEPEAIVSTAILVLIYAITFWVLARNHVDE